MQRILPRGEIEAPDHNRIPRIQLPERASVPATRRASAPSGRRKPGGRLPAADGRPGRRPAPRALQDCQPPGADEDRISLAQAHAAAAGGGLAARPAVAGHPGAPGRRGRPGARHARRGRRGLRRAAPRRGRGPEALEDLAEAVLAEQDHGVDGAAALFVMAALQVYWTSLASRFDEKQLPVTSPFGVCPVCLPAGGQHRARGRPVRGLPLPVLQPVLDPVAHGAREVLALRGRGIGGLSGHRRPLRGHQGRDLRPLPQLSQDLLPGQGSARRAGGRRPGQPDAGRAGRRGRLRPRQRQPLLWNGAEEE